MARFAQILSPAGDAVIKVSPGAGTSTTETLVGSRRIFSVVSDADVNIKFGVTGMGAASVADYLIPSKQQTVFDMGTNTHVRIFSTAGGNAWILRLEGR